MISFHCPACRATLTANSQQAGGSMVCPTCKAAVSVPAGDATTSQKPAPRWQSVVDVQPTAISRRSSGQQSGRPQPSSGMVVLLIVGIVALVGFVGAVVIVVAGALFWTRTTSVAGARAAQAAQAQVRITRADVAPDPDDGPAPLPLKTLQAQRPAQPFGVRGDCELSTEFNHEFRESKKTHYSIRLTQKNPNAVINCYVARESEDGRKLFKLLSDGESRMLTLECEFVRDDPSVAKLVRVVRFE